MLVRRPLGASLPTFQDILPLLRGLAEQESDITAAITSLDVQLFWRAEVRHPDPGVLLKLDDLAKGHIFNDQHFLDVGGLLGAFAKRLFCFGNIGLVTDLRSESMRFRFVQPDFENRDVHGDTFLSLPSGISITSIRRKAKLDDGYGCPYLLPALDDYRRLLQVENADMAALQGVISDPSGRQMHVDAHQQLFSKARDLRGRVIKSMGFIPSPNDVHAISRVVGTELFDETIETFMTHVVKPVCLHRGVNVLPDISVPSRPIS